MYSVNVKKYNKLSHIEKRAGILAIYIVVNGKGLGVVRKPWWEPNHLDCGEGLMGLGREDLGGLKARGSLGEMEDYIRLLLTTFRTLAHNIKKKKKKKFAFLKKTELFSIERHPTHLILLPPTIPFAASKKWPHMPRGGGRLAVAQNLVFLFLIFLSYFVYNFFVFYPFKIILLPLCSEWRDEQN